MQLQSLTLRDLCLLKFWKLKVKTKNLIPPHLESETINQLKKLPPHTHIQFPQGSTPIWSVKHAIYIHPGGRTLQQQQKLKEVGYLFSKDLTLRQKKVHFSQCQHILCQYDDCIRRLDEVRESFEAIRRKLTRLNITSHQTIHAHHSLLPFPSTT